MESNTDSDDNLRSVIQRQRQQAQQIADEIDQQRSSLQPSEPHVFPVSPYPEMEENVLTPHQPDLRENEPEEVKITEYFSNLIQSERQAEEHKVEETSAVEEIFICQICFIQFSDGTTSKQISNKPLLIPCGHTICCKCLKYMVNTNKNDKKTIKCPLDKTEHTVAKSVENTFPVNYSIIKGLNAFNSSKKFANTFKRYCQVTGHQSESINFYCKTHRKPLCQLCLIDGHLGKCEVSTSKEALGEEIFKDEAQKCILQLENQVKALKHQKTQMYENYFGESKNFEFLSKQILTLIENQSKEVLAKYEDEYNQQTGSHEIKIEECERVIQDLQQASQEDGEALIREAIDHIQEDLENEGKLQTRFFDEAFLIPKHLSCHFLLEDKNMPVDPNLEKMIEGLQNKGIQNQQVLDIFRQVDRKFFLNTQREESGFGSQTAIEDPYKDVPKQIGWSTTISAPSMHAQTLSHLASKLRTASTVLDIGTGSGFITAAMAQMIPNHGKVYAVDHIEDINEFARANIKKTCPHLMRREKVIFVTQDGRKGLSTYWEQPMKYDVIHVGGQLNEVEDQLEYVKCSSGEIGSRRIRVDTDLLDQLAPGGRMWIPLASKDDDSPERNLLEAILRRGGSRRDVFAHHEVYVIDRDEETLELKYTKIMDARYAQLRSVEEQLEDD